MSMGIEDFYKNEVENDPTWMSQEVSKRLVNGL